MKGLKEVFTFTLSRQLSLKGSRILTIVMALLFLVIPPSAMVLSELARETDAYIETEDMDFNIETEDTDFNDEPEAVDGPFLKTVFLVNESGLSIDESSVTALFSDDLTKEPPVFPDSLEKALQLEKETAGSVVLRLYETEDRLEVRAIVPEGTPEDGRLYEEAWAAASALEYGLTEIIRLPGYADVPENRLPSSVMGRIITPEDSMSGDEQENQMLKEIIVMILPYVNIMLIYFLVLYYGQTAANSVILEKTSKLMDTFLVAVRPKAMIFGKILAVWTAALMQFLLWIVCLIAGFSSGTFLVRAMNPDSTLGILKLFTYLKGMTQLFSGTAVLESVLMILSGFLMYCCIAGICASFASRPEELSSTLGLFSITLVISMLVCLRVGFLSGDMARNVKWFDLVPFTAILITPSRILLGYVSLNAGLLSLIIVISVSVAFVLFSGKVYRLMSLYKGNVPKLKDMLKIMFTP